MFLLKSKVLYLLIFLIGIGLGFYGSNKLNPSNAEQPQQTKVITKTKIIKQVKPNGEVVETTEIDQKIDNKDLIKKKYGIGIFHNKELYLEARLGDLPFFLIGMSDLNKEHKVGIKLEF